MTKVFIVGPEDLFQDVWPDEVMIGNSRFGFAKDVMAELKGSKVVFVLVGEEAMNAYDSLPLPVGNEYLIYVDEFDDWVCDWVNATLENQGTEVIDWFDF